MSVRTLCASHLVLLPCLASQPSPGQTVRDAAGLRAAVASAKPGTRILLAPGTYPGGFSFPNLRGETNQPIVIAAAHPENPPLIRVEGNTFIGGGAAMAFVGVDGAVVRFNTIYRPQRWALRILQENSAPGFVPSRNVEFTDNIIAFHSSQWANGGVNIGANTAPRTFKFARNWWHCLDNQARSRPTLPLNETGGVYGQAPQFRGADGGDVRLLPDSPARSMGVEALPE